MGRYDNVIVHASESEAATAAVEGPAGVEHYGVFAVYVKGTRNRIRVHDELGVRTDPKLSAAARQFAKK